MSVRCDVIELDYNVHCKYIFPLFKKPCDDFPDKCKNCIHNKIVIWNQKHPPSPRVSYYKNNLEE